MLICELNVFQQANHLLATTSKKTTPSSFPPTLISFTHMGLVPRGTEEEGTLSPWLEASEELVGDTSNESGSPGLEYGELTTTFREAAKQKKKGAKTWIWSRRDREGRKKIHPVIKKWLFVLNRGPI